MDRSTRPRLFGWRGATLIAVGVVVGSLVLAPGVGLAAKFLTKQQVKKRYLGNTTIATVTGTAPANASGTADVFCPSGRQATGGGATAPGVINPSASYSGIVVLESKPIGVGRSTGWHVEALGLNDTSTGTIQFTAYAVCSA
jgi:hypothetical protein